MNIFLKFNEKQRNLLIESGNEIENRDYSDEEIQKIKNNIASHIFNMSKNEIQNE